jgi:hypothetical protein
MLEKRGRLGGTRVKNLGVIRDPGGARSSDEEGSKWIKIGTS